MKVKEIWITDDFEKMGWHDCHIHSIYFHDREPEIHLDIDYLFEWVLDEKDRYYKFWISPCILIFYCISNLEIHLSFGDNNGLNISEIKRYNPILTPNGEGIDWTFEIITDMGYIKFNSTEFKQIVKQQPRFIQDQVLDRGYTNI